MSLPIHNSQPQVSPPQLPALVRGQQIRDEMPTPTSNTTEKYLKPPYMKGNILRDRFVCFIWLIGGPYVVTVTDSMVAERERANRELIRRWEAEQLRRQRRMEDQDEYMGDFKEFNVRRRFLRRVFSILTLQLMFMSLAIATFIFYEPAREVMMTHRYLWVTSMGVFLFTYIAISCSQCARRSAPVGVVLLILLTVSLSYLTATISVFYSVESVLIAASATALVTFIIWSITACTKFDLTKRVGFMLIVSLVGTIGTVAMIIALQYTHIRALHVAIAVVGALLISMYLFFDLQTIMGGRMIELSPDEVIYATTQVFVDVALLYRYILLLSNFE